MRNFFKFSFLLFILSQYSVLGQVVSNNSQLQSAISNASAGTTITLANGTWTNIYLSINKNGNASNPIKIVAQTAGQVFFEGN